MRLRRFLLCAAILTAALAGRPVSLAMSARHQAPERPAPAPAPPAPAAALPAPVPVPAPVVEPDPALTWDLAAVVALSPQNSCLVVAIDDVEVFTHRSEDPMIPASTNKLLTASAARQLLGADTRYATRLVSTAPVVDGVVQGDVHLVGSGDPVLSSSLYRVVRAIDADRPTTDLDDLAAQLRAQGIDRIEGSIVGDETRYDDLRVAPTWPDRYAAQNQSGPLSALTVDGGYTLRLTDEGFERRRSSAPALDGARTLTALMAAAGVTVDGESAVGAAPASSTVLASVSSPPMSQIVDDMVRRSDNQVAELLAKELAVHEGKAGSTAAGAEVITRWASDQEILGPGTAVVDGSGLDRGNRLSCESLMNVWDVAGGPNGALAGGLPVAGTSGTLTDRFAKTAARGVLRAKTGSLAEVTALAGHVALRRGGVATFAYVANGEPVTPEVLAAQDFLAQILATYEPSVAPDTAAADAPAAD